MVSSLAITGLPETSSQSSLAHDVSFLSLVAGPSTLSTISDSPPTPTPPSFRRSDGSSRSPAKRSSSPAKRDASALTSHPPQPPHRDPAQQQPRRPIHSRSAYSAPTLTPFIATPTSPMKRAWKPCNPLLSPSVGVVDLGTGEGEISPSKSLAVNLGREKSKGEGEGKGKGRAVETADMHEGEDQGQLASGSGSGSGTGRRKKKGNDKGEERRKGWGEAVVSGAMTAGVFGAALGLSAYRLWANRNDPTASHADDDTLSPPNDSDTSSLPDPVIPEEQIARGMENERREHAGHGDRDGDIDDSQIQIRRQMSTINSVTESSRGGSSQSQSQQGIAVQAEHEQGQVVESRRGRVEEDARNLISPPPAYEETERFSHGKGTRRGRGRDTSKSEWEEDEERLMTPSSSKILHRQSASYSRRRRHVKKPSQTNFAILRQRPSKSVIDPAYAATSDRISTAHIDDTALPAFAPAAALGAESGIPTDRDVEDMVVPLETSRETGTQPSDGEGDADAVRGVNENDDEDGDGDGDEVSARLDQMSEQLRILIQQGRDALSQSSGLGVTPGWEDIPSCPNLSNLATMSIDSSLVVPSSSNKYNKHEMQQANPTAAFTPEKMIGAGPSSCSSSCSPNAAGGSPSKIPRRIQSGHLKSCSEGKEEAAKREERGSKIPVRSRSMVMGMVAS